MNGTTIMVDRPKHTDNFWVPLSLTKSRFELRCDIFQEELIVAKQEKLNGWLLPGQRCSDCAGPLKYHRIGMLLEFERSISVRCDIFIEELLIAKQKKLNGWLLSGQRCRKCTGLLKYHRLLRAFVVQC